MTDDEALLEIQHVLQHLEEISFVAYRDARQALPAAEALGPQAALTWLDAARDLFFHDREAGKAFMRHSPEVVARIGAVQPWVEQALGFARWVNAWPALEGYMQQVGEVYSDWGAEAERRWYEIGLRWCARSLEDAAAYFRTPAQRLAAGQGPEALERFLAPAERLYEERGLGLEVYLQGAMTARELVGMEEVERWARRGADILQAGRARGEAYFRLESEESLRLLLEGMPGYRMRRHGRFLQLLVTAWLGGPVELGDGDWRPGRGRPMVETDGRRLLLPAVLGSREEAVVAVLHAAAHLRFDTYAQALIRRLFAEAGMEHPPLDADQRITWRPLFARYGARMFRFQVLFDLCEDLRVDARLGAMVPGYLERLRRLARAQAEPEGAAGVYYRYALAQLEALIEARGLDRRLAPLWEPAADVVTAFGVANRLFDSEEFPELDVEQREAAYLPGRGYNTGRPVYPRRRWQETGGYNDATDAHGRQEPRRERQPAPPAGTVRQHDPDPDINLPRENTAGSGGRVGVGIPVPAAVSAQGAAREEGGAGLPYPEWDYREQRYIADWAWVQERRLEEGDAARAEALLAEHRSVLKRLRRALELQRPQRTAPLRRQFEGDELDMEAAVAYVVDKRSGLSPKPQIYRRRAVQHRDTAVLLLADMSTSIMARHPRGGGKVVDRLRAGLLLFSEALKALGDAHAICGFASKHHDNVHYYVLKDFDEPAGAGTRARIAGLSGRLASRMGAAIRHSLRRFETVQAQRRLLLILSDGRPADYDDGGDPRYLHEDTRMAMKQAVDAGVHPFCVTLDPSGSQYLPAIFGPGHYTVLDNVDELPRRLPEIYLRLRR